jgi:hypothetical protein
MKHLIAAAVAATLVLASCAKDPVDQPDNTSSNNQIKIAAPQVGQTTRFVRFKASSCLPGPIAYVADTIELTIVSNDASGIVLRERYTPKSESIVNPSANPDGGIYSDTDEIKLLASIQNGSLTVSGPADPGPRPRIFPHFPVSFKLSANTDVQRTETEWRIDGGPTEEGYLNNHIQRNVTYPSLNVRSDLGAMAVDGPGFFHLYDPQAGFVRSAYIGGFCASGGGWDVLEN